MTKPHSSNHFEYHEAIEMNEQRLREIEKIAKVGYWELDLETYKYSPIKSDLSSVGD